MTGEPINAVVKSPIVLITYGVGDGIECLENCLYDKICEC